MTDATVQEKWTQPKTITVELLKPLRQPLGGYWGPGERAGFSEEDARDLIARGIAQLATPKAPSAPPANKMEAGVSTQKK